MQKDLEFCLKRKTEGVLLQKLPQSSLFKRHRHQIFVLLINQQKIVVEKIVLSAFTNRVETVDNCSDFRWNLSLVRKKNFAKFRIIYFKSRIISFGFV